MLPPSLLSPSLPHLPLSFPPYLPLPPLSLPSPPSHSYFSLLPLYLWKNIKPQWHSSSLQITFHTLLFSRHMVQRSRDYNLEVPYAGFLYMRSSLHSLLSGNNCINHTCQLTPSRKRKSCDKLNLIHNLFTTSVWTLPGIVQHWLKMNIHLPCLNSISNFSGLSGDVRGSEVIWYMSSGAGVCDKTWIIESQWALNECGLGIIIIK